MTWSRWVALCSATEGPTAQALFRIGVGLVTLAALGSVAWNGLVQVLWLHADHGGVLRLDHVPWLIGLLGGARPEVIWPLTVLALAGAASVTLGLGGRGVALGTALVVGNLVDVNPHAGGSYDELLTNALWLVVLSGGHRSLSVEAWWRTGTFVSDTPILAFPRWLTIWQLCLMYGTTGLQKVSTYWVPGGESSALYYILQQPTWQRGDMSWVAWVFPLSQVATTLTWFWEVFAFFWILAVWYSATPDRPGRLRGWSNRVRLRWVFAGIGVVMHLLIFATLEVGPFSPLSLCFYVATVHPWEWDALRRRLLGGISARR